MRLVQPLGFNITRSWSAKFCSAHTGHLQTALPRTRIAGRTSASEMPTCIVLLNEKQAYLILAPLVSGSGSERVQQPAIALMT